MPDLPKPLDPDVASADELLQLIVLELLFNKIVSSIAAGLPFLQLPVLSTIYAWVMSQIAGFFYKPLENWVATGIISIKVDGQASGYDAAKIALKKAQEAGDPIAHEQAKADFKAKFQKLIHTDGE